MEPFFYISPPEAASMDFELKLTALKTFFWNIATGCVVCLKGTLRRIILFNQKLITLMQAWVDVVIVAHL